MALLKLCRTPAVDRSSDELLGADEEGEADQYDDGVLTTQSIDVVVVDVELEFPDAQHRLEETIHVGRLSVLLGVVVGRTDGRCWH